MSSHYRWALSSLTLLVVAPLFAVDDPTRPPRADTVISRDSADAPDFESVRVGMVRVGDDGRRALINGRWVDEGARVEGVRVVRIHHDAVELESEGVTRIQRVVSSTMEKRQR